MKATLERSAFKSGMIDGVWVDEWIYFLTEELRMTEEEAEELDSIDIKIDEII